jgi:uncharacterized lipoprotein YajG
MYCKLNSLVIKKKKEKRKRLFISLYALVLTTCSNPFQSLMGFNIVTRVQG